MFDNASITQLVEEHGKWILAFLRGFLRNNADADDAFQETWLRLMKSRGDFRGVGMKTYLAKTARSVAIDRLRRQHPTESLDAVDDHGVNLAESIEDSSPSPSEQYESEASAAEVRKAIDALPLNLRQVVLLRIEGEMEFKEIAAELGIPLGTALTWMRKATQKLKAVLGENHG